MLNKYFFIFIFIIIFENIIICLNRRHKNKNRYWKYFECGIASIKKKSGCGVDYKFLKSSDWGLDQNTRIADMIKNLKRIADLINWEFS